MLFSRSSRRRTRTSALPLLFLTVLGLLVGGLGAPAYAANTISGIVKNRDGLALSGVVVKLGTESNGAFQQEGASKTTDANGAYSFTGVASGDYFIQYTGASGVDAAAYYDGENQPVVTALADATAVSSGANDSSANPRLLSRTITGKITTGDPAVPVEGVAVKVEAATDSPRTYTAQPTAPSSVVTDAQGSYTLTVAQQPNLILGFSKSGYQTVFVKDASTTAQKDEASLITFATAGTPTTFNRSITATPGSISGKVTRVDSVRTPAIPGATVTLLTATGGDSGIDPETTDANGTYEFEDVSPAKYQVKFESPSGDGYETEFYNEKTASGTPDLVEVKPGVANDAVNATLVKTTTSEISGVVSTSTGVPIKGVTVSLHVRANADGGTGTVTYDPPLASPTAPLSATTGDDGRFAIEGALDNSYVVKYSSDAFQTLYFNGGGAGSTNPDTARTITLTKNAGAAANVSVALNSGVTFTGSVTDGSTALKDVEVKALYPIIQSNGGIVWTAAASVKTAANGSFTLVAPTVAGRQYIVSYSYPEYLTVYRLDDTNGPTVKSAGSATKYSAANAVSEPLGAVALARGTYVTGKVTDAQGLPLAGVTVDAIVAGTTPKTWGRVSSSVADVVTTGADGVFVMTVTPEATGTTTFRLRATRDGRVTTYFPNVYGPDGASNVAVTTNQVVTGRDISVPEPSVLAGSFTRDGGSQFTGSGIVELWKRVVYTDNGQAGGASHSEWRQAASRNLDSGAFSFSVAPGDYKIRTVLADNSQGFMPGLVGLDQAPTVSLGVEQMLGEQKYALPATAEIRGTVTNLTGSAVPDKAISAVYRYVTNVVDGAPQLSPWIAVTPAKLSNSAGGYTLPVYARTYRVGALGAGGAVDVPGSGAGQNDEGYFTSGTPTSAINDADDVTVGGEDVTGIDFRLNVGAPVNVQPPYVTGISAEGETLTAEPGLWSASDTDFDYDWQFRTATGSWQPASADTTGSFSVGGIDGRELTIGTSCTIPMIFPPGCNTGYTAYAYRVVVTATRAGANGGTKVLESKGTGVAATPAFPGTGAATTTENRQDPQVMGKAIVGETLTATDGVWSEGGTFSYQWLANGQVVAGATAKTLQVGPDLLGMELRFRVTETSSNPDQVVLSAATPAVGKGALKNTVLPTISGDVLVSKTLTAEPGTWNDPSPTFAYQWLANGQAITGATNNKLVLTDAELGKSIAVRVTATKGTAYSPGSATSTSTAAVGDDPTKVVSKTKPIVSGTAKVGETLSTTDGTWSNEPTGFAYQWLADGTAVTGATSSTFVLTKDQRGKKMSVRVTASKSGLASGTATSEETVAVAGGPLENKTKPTITGQTLEGATLTADPGTWEPETVTPVFTYQWVADGANIAGATSRTYTLTSAEVGKTITVKVTASANGFDSGTATSAGVGPIDEPQGEITVTGGPSIAGTDAVGELLSLNPGSVTPGDATITVQWFRDGTAITGATARTYRLVAADEDALITARVTYAKDDFVTLVKSTSAVGPVEPEAEEPDPVKPTLQTSKKIKGKKLVVKVRVFADSQDPVTGQVKLKEGKAFTVLKTLNNGKKKLVVKGLKKGYHSVKLTFLGNDLVKKKSKTLNFTIR